VKFKVATVFCAAWVAAGTASAQDAAGETTFTITKVSVDGNKYFKDDRIKDLLRIEKGQQYKYLFDYMLEQGIAAVKKAYYAEGYADVKIRWAFRDVKPGKRKLQLHVDEGPRAKITDVLLDGVGQERYLDVRENLGVEVGSPLSASLLNEAAMKIGRYYHERGYVYASVQLQIDRDTGSRAKSIIRLNRIGFGARRK